MSNPLDLLHSCNDVACINFKRCFVCFFKWRETVNIEASGRGRYDGTVSSRLFKNGVIFRFDFIDKRVLIHEVLYFASNAVR